jgi:hypothetical protein
MINLNHEQENGKMGILPVIVVLIFPSADEL